jgi:hypothetical protein
MRCLYGKLSRKIGKDLAGDVVEWTMARRPLEEDRVRLLYQLMNESAWFFETVGVADEDISWDGDIWTHKESRIFVSSITGEIWSSRDGGTTSLSLIAMQRAMMGGIGIYPLERKWFYTYRSVYL